MSDQEHVFSAALGLDSRGKPLVRARCTCGWYEEIVGTQKNREDAEEDARLLFEAHVIRSDE